MSNLLINPSLASSSLDHRSVAPNLDIVPNPPTPHPTVSDSSSGSPSITSQSPTAVSEPSDPLSTTSSSSSHQFTPPDLKARQTSHDVHISKMTTLSSPPSSPTSHKLTYYMDHQLLDSHSDHSRNYIGSLTKTNVNNYTSLHEWFISCYLDEIYAPFLFPVHVQLSAFSCASLFLALIACKVPPTYSSPSSVAPKVPESSLL